MSDATPCVSAVPPVTSPDLTTFARLDSLGLRVLGQQVWPDKAVLFCSPTAGEDHCPRCAAAGHVYDTLVRRFTHLPFGRKPTWLHVRVPRYRCSGCGRVWLHSLKTVARARSKLTRLADWWALSQVVLDHAPVSGVAAVLGVSWGTAHDAVAELGTQVLIQHPGRLDGVEVIGVDEHAWRHTRKGDKYVTVVIDLTPIRNQTGPARLLDLVEGRSKQVFKTWLDDQSDQFRQRVQIVAMDGFTGFKTAATEAVPDAVTVMDPFHVVALAGDKLNQTRQRVQRELTGERGHRDDPLYNARRTLRTGRALLTDRQHSRLQAVFGSDDVIAVEITWLVYQDIIDAYRTPDRTSGRKLLATVIDRIKAGVPTALVELAQLGRTLHQRRDDILAWFDHQGSSNGPTEAINGRLEHLRGIALGFRNLVNYRLRSLLEAGGFRPLIHSLS